MLSPQLLTILRGYWRLARPRQRTFPDAVGTSHLCQERKWPTGQDCGGWLSQNTAEC